MRQKSYKNLHEEFKKPAKKTSPNFLIKNKEKKFIIENQFKEEEEDIFEDKYKNKKMPPLKKGGDSRSKLR